jgi:hypothetical protein
MVCINSRRVARLDIENTVRLIEPRIVQYHSNETALDIVPRLI